MNNKITDATILATGGAGFVGSYVVEELLQHQPKKIIIIDNLIRGSHYNMQSFISNPVVEFIEGDVRDAALLEKCITYRDAVPF
ncbi:MAG: GDP-mannose 4,6-dehydratase [Sphingobacteriales bacterium]|nr:GDP-mannose 4,6-dehydratase [Sphingobacteriales bacterium]